MTAMAAGDQREYSSHPLKVVSLEQGGFDDVRFYAYFVMLNLKTDDLHEDLYLCSLRSLSGGRSGDCNVILKITFLVLPSGTQAIIQG
jgi:hypothetical protein